jgi:class 3 adenylate cyclase/predicted ATPase
LLVSVKIYEWLGNLGLGQYASAFEENAVDWSTLSELDHELLKELGVTAVGHRVAILKAIKNLEPETVKKGGAVTSPPIPNAEAERRQLTVMFCDLVGSTELSQKLDPEDLREVNRAYQDASKSSIERYEGFVARYMGDGVLAYFGYPQAHEDDAERAILAGLELIEAVSDLNRDVGADKALDLAVRVGIATGPVVVGDLIGEGASQESPVVGETPNLAARLQGLAAPGTVVIGASTRELCVGQFEYADLGLHKLKGIANDVNAWRAIGPMAAESRFDAAHRAELTAFHGREQEIALLLDRWNTAKTGEGQVALLSGEAGIGKSRITQTFRQRLATEPHLRILYQCSPHHTNSALYPAISQLQIAAGIMQGEETDQKLDKLEALLRQSEAESPQTMALFASLLSIPTKNRYPPLELTPQALKEQTLQAFNDQLAGLAHRQPVLVELEDAHWADPTTLELMSRAVDTIQQLEVLIVITFRPDFDCPWTSHAHTTALALNRLTRSQSVEIITGICGGKELPTEVLDQILVKTDGVPLFVEELTKNVLESSLVTETPERYVLAGPLPPLAIPASLQDSLMARLDRLAPVKELAQMGAAIGREFSYELVRRLSGMTDNELQDGLHRLIEAELIFRRGTPPKATYIFKHALVQDTAYSSLLKSRRQKLHADIAKILAEKFTEEAELQPEMLARHYSEAGLAEPAIEYWQAAADRSIACSAYVETINHLDQALYQLRQLPEGSSRDKRELKLQVLRLGPLLPVKGYASPELDEASARALELCRESGDLDALFPTLYTRWVIQYVKSVQAEVFELSREYLERAKAEGDDAARMVGFRIHGVAHLLRGDVEGARDHCRQALELYIPEKHRPLVSRFGQDLKVQAINYLCVSEALLGRIDSALALGMEAIDHARDLNHVNTMAYALWHIGVWLPAIVRDVETVHRYGAELLNLALEQKMGFWEAFGRPHVVVNGYEHSPADAARGTEQAIEVYRSKFNGLLIVPELLCRVADAYLDASLTSEAERVLRQAAELMAQTGEIYWMPELYRLRGRLGAMVGHDRQQQAIEEFQRAISLAQERNTKLLELRAATGLASLLAERDERARAIDALAPIYDSFSEGFDAMDLVEAKALLEQLA